MQKAFFILNWGGRMMLKESGKINFCKVKNGFLNYRQIEKRNGRIYCRAKKRMFITVKPA